MSHFYGRLNGSRGEATRCGHKTTGMTTIAASWRGAILVQLWHDEDSDQDWALVEMTPWHGHGINRELYRGPVDAEAGGES